MSNFTTYESYIVKDAENMEDKLYTMPNCGGKVFTYKEMRKLARRYGYKNVDNFINETAQFENKLKNGSFTLTVVTSK